MPSSQIAKSQVKSTSTDLSSAATSVKSATRETPIFTKQVAKATRAVQSSPHPPRDMHPPPGLASDDGNSIVDKVQKAHATRAAPTAPRVGLDETVVALHVQCPSEQSKIDDVTSRPASSRTSLTHVLHISSANADTEHNLTQTQRQLSEVQKQAHLLQVKLKEMEAAEKTHELRSTGRDEQLTLTQNTLEEVKKKFEETEHRRKESETELQQTLHSLAHEKAEKMSVSDALSDSRSRLEVLAAQVRAGKEMERKWRLEDTQRGEEEEKRRLEERRQEAARDVVEQTRREKEREREEEETRREQMRREEEQRRDEAEKKREKADIERSAKLQVVMLCYIIHLYTRIYTYIFLYTHRAFQ